MLDHIYIVLVEPSHPGNIGSVARAMKTMGLSKLILVNPKKFPHPQAIDLASKAHDILDVANVVGSVSEAVADCELVLGFSARKRDLDCSFLPLEELGEATVPNRAKVALLFGREHAGLTNEELSFCQKHIMIPSVSTFQSLNLSHAVQIACYEIRKTALKQMTSENSSKSAIRKLATQSEIVGMFDHLEQTIKTIGFYKPEQSNKLMPKIKRMFNRSQLESQEVNIMRGILTAMNKVANGDKT